MTFRLTKNDKRARFIIIGFSLLIFFAITFLGRIDLDVDLGFDEHVFAGINAVINSIVAVLLLAGLYTAKKRKYRTHKKIMLLAMSLSVLFLISYVCHHLFAGDTKFGGTGNIRIFYYIILVTHILLAGIVLPFILFTAYRALIDENEAHRKLAKYTWPIWFYVALTGPLVYLMVSPYYT